MSVNLPTIQVGDPIRHKGLDVFPLFGNTGADVQYDLSDEAIDRGSVAVEEISESGSVPELAVDNQGDQSVLFLEGEELIGAKQNRILNTSVLIAAHSKSKIPVSCVEAGRWGYSSRQFGSSGSHSPHRLRYAMKASVSASVRQQRGHRSDQGKVWEEVSRQQKALGARSGTAAMSDTFSKFEEQLQEFRNKLKYVEGAIGAAIAMDGKVIAIDLFDKPMTCQKVWNRMLSGAMLHALETSLEETEVVSAESDEVEKALETVRQLSWEPTAAVGEGEEFRAESAGGDHASVLVLDGTVVHGSLVCAK